ncbi:hypothetical protein MNBD_NITROSPINAE02-1048 [hydrothermal vent metagenome]|uniref:Uncharacterized protein n=1 Tax=hydrothermal vent metagenome TaxID=652676 RepID=A0A3B1C2L9_9ZZZZ
MTSPGIFAQKLNQAALAFCLFGLFSFAITWPLVINITTHLHQGGEPVPTVPFLNLWTIGWNADRALHFFANYWNAPIFYPVPGAFAFSDPQPLTGLIAAPLYYVNPALSYNVVMLVFMLLNGFSVYRLLRGRGMGFWPAFLGGLLAESLPILTEQRGVLQLQPFFGIVFAIDCLWNLAERPNLWYGAGFGLGVAVTFLTSEYYGLFAVFVLVPSATVLCFKLFNKRALYPLALGTVLCGALVMPVLIPQYTILSRTGSGYSAEMISSLSASPVDYLHPSKSVLASRIYPFLSHEKKRLFPGFALIALGLAGAAIGLGREDRRLWTIFLLSVIAMTFIGSLGPRLDIMGWRPYENLSSAIPSLNNVRNLFRLALFVQLSLALLAATLFEAMIARRLHLVVAGLALFALVEAAPLPGRLAPSPLFSFKPSMADSPMVVLPYTKGRSAKHYQQTAFWMAASLSSGVTLVNGYSGRFTEINNQLRDLLADFPAEQGLRVLRSLGVKGVAIDSFWLSRDQRDRITTALDSGELIFKGFQKNLIYFSLSGSRFRPVGEYKGGWEINARRLRDKVRVSAMAAIKDDRVYVMVPGKAEPKWKITYTDKHGFVTSHMVTPKWSIAIYAGAKQAVTVVTPPPPPRKGGYTVRLIDARSGRVLGEAKLSV